MTLDEAHEVENGDDLWLTVRNNVIGFYVTRCRATYPGAHLTSSVWMVCTDDHWWPSISIQWAFRSEEDARRAMVLQVLRTP